MKRKRNLFSQHPIQQKYLKFILLAMSLPTILVASCLYYLIWQIVAHELAIPELIADALIPAFNQVNYILLFGLPIIFAVILFFAIRMTHRLAGPIERIEKTLLHMVEENNFSKEIRIRKSDDLQSLVQQINQTIQEASKRPPKTF